jgi:hypothetical protein
MNPLLLDERRSIAATIVWGMIISSLSLAAETARSIRPSGAEAVHGTETVPAPVTGTSIEGSDLFPLFRRENFHGFKMIGSHPVLHLIP